MTFKFRYGCKERLKTRLRERQRNVLRRFINQITSAYTVWTSSSALKKQASLHALIELEISDRRCFSKAACLLLLQMKCFCSRKNRRVGFRQQRVSSARAQVRALRYGGARRVNGMQTRSRSRSFSRTSSAEAAGAVASFQAHTARCRRDPMRALHPNRSGFVAMLVPCLSTSECRHRLAPHHPAHIA